MDITDYLDPQQIDAMLEYAKTCNPRYYLVLRLLWRSGMRVSELRAVKPSDVEPQNQIINFTRAKGNKQRRVTVDPGTLAMLSDYIVAMDIPAPHFHPLERPYLAGLPEIRQDDRGEQPASTYPPTELCDPSHQVGSRRYATVTAASQPHQHPDEYHLSAIQGFGFT